MTDSWLTHFVTVRNKALRELDLDFARQMCPGASGDDVLLTALHKARYDCPSIERELRLESAAWLRERGLGGMFLPLLPEGELPK